MLVGDRGMITEARLREDIRKQEGIDWITALRGPSIRKLVQGGSLQLSLFDETDLAEISDPAYPGERLVVCRNPLLAHERSRKREDLLHATEKKLDNIVSAATRRSRRLRGKDKIALRVGKILDSYKVGKHFQIEITDESFSYCRDHERIAEEASLDGIYVIRTSVPAHSLSSEDTVRAYKGLAVAERVFRSLKTVDLKVRPIYHWVPERVRAHVLLCMLAYYVEWHMRRGLAPMLFEDDEREEAQAIRESVVAPARRSLRAVAKSQTKRTCEGTPAHSFQTLLADLATLTKNKIRTKLSETAFQLPTTPTPIQRQALKLLHIPLKM